MNITKVTLYIKPIKKHSDYLILLERLRLILYSSNILDKVKRKISSHISILYDFSSISLNLFIRYMYLYAKSIRESEDFQLLKNHYNLLHNVASY